LAVRSGLNAEGGSRNFHFATRSTESGLHHSLRLVRGTRRPQTSFFLRAESFFNVASHIERLDEEPAFGPPVAASYGGVSLHRRSHGEAFLALVSERFGPKGVYLLDEPEAALSPQRQLSLLMEIHRLVAADCQFVIATHSPILLAYPASVILQLDERGISTIAYRDTDHFRLTLDFLSRPERYLQRLGLGR
jgi:predicted ATPase